MKIKQPIRKCLECDGPLYDNRADKASGKRKKAFPDFKCKNDGDHAFWVDKKGDDVAPEYQADDEPRANPSPSSRAAAGGAAYSWQDLRGAYQACLKLARKEAPDWPAEAIAIASQGLLEQAVLLGLKHNPTERPAEATRPAVSPPEHKADPKPPPKPEPRLTPTQGHPSPAPPIGDPEYGGSAPPRPVHRYRGPTATATKPRTERGLDLPAELDPEDDDDGLPF